MAIRCLFSAVVCSAIALSVSCSSSLQPGSGQGGSGGALSGRGGSEGEAGTHGGGGTAGGAGFADDGGGGSRACGNTVCTQGEYCCDALCSVCAPVGALCTQGCPLGDAGPDPGACASLRAQYYEALTAARSCAVGASGTCAAMVHSTLPADVSCGCDLIYVNDATQPVAVYQTWVSLGCQAPPSTCRAVCAPLGVTGVCVAPDGGTTGTCQFGAGR